jgi:hypothetical protein
MEARINSIPILHAFPIEVKRWLLIGMTLIPVLGSSSVHAQGAIWFANRSGTPFIDERVTDGRTGAWLAGEAWTAQLYYSEDLSPRTELRPAFPATHFMNADIFPNRGGYIVPVTVIVPGTTYRQIVAVEMRVWNTAAGSTYEEAAANPNGVVGSSERFDVLLFDTRTPGYLLGLNPFSVHPVSEPSALCMLLTGIFGFAILKKRKSYK